MAPVCEARMTASWQLGGSSMTVLRRLRSCESRKPGVHWFELLKAGRGVAFPCDLSNRVRRNDLYARAMAGSELAPPCVEAALPERQHRAAAFALPRLARDPSNLST